MADLTVQQMTAPGGPVIFVAADAAGDDWNQSYGVVLFYVLNPGGAFAATFKAKRKDSQGFLNDYAVTIPNALSIWGPFPSERFGAVVRIEYGVTPTGVGVRPVRSPRLA